MNPHSPESPKLQDFLKVGGAIIVFNLRFGLAIEFSIAVALVLLGVGAEGSLTRNFERSELFSVFKFTGGAARFHDRVGGFAAE